VGAPTINKCERNAATYFIERNQNSCLCKGGFKQSSKQKRTFPSHRTICLSSFWREDNYVCFFDNKSNTIGGEKQHFSSYYTTNISKERPGLHSFFSEDFRIVYGGRSIQAKSGNTEGQDCTVFPLRISGAYMERLRGASDHIKQGFS
jgi:hypothetical protein